MTSQNLKKILSNLWTGKLWGLAKKHIRRIRINEQWQVVTVFVDRTYAFKEFTSDKYITKIITAIRKAFGEEYNTSIKQDIMKTSRERENMVPKKIWTG